jgi:hypothetical protein
MQLWLHFCHDAISGLFCLRDCSACDNCPVQIRHSMSLQFFRKLLKLP